MSRVPYLDVNCCLAPSGVRDINVHWHCFGSDWRRFLYFKYGGETHENVALVLELIKVILGHLFAADKNTSQSKTKVHFDYWWSGILVVSILQRLTEWMEYIISILILFIYTDVQRNSFQFVYLPSNWISEVTSACYYVTTTIVCVQN